MLAEPRSLKLEGPEPGTSATNFRPPGATRTMPVASSGTPNSTLSAIRCWAEVPR